MREGERQVSPTIEGVRKDHVARYEFVAKHLKKGESVIDVACGIGYGTQLMAKAGADVVGYDIDKEAIEYARKHYSQTRARFAVQDINEFKSLKKFDIAVAFECIEHVEDPRPMLKALRQSAKTLFCSVPNEEVFPHNGRILYHYRHYTKGQFKALLNETGWDVKHWLGQEGPESDVEPEVNGRTLVAVCVPGEVKNVMPIGKPFERGKTPKHVAILGLGPSIDEYTNLTKRLGGRHRYCDEVWTINALGQVFDCDRIFHMDDVRIQELRARARPQSNIAAMVEWMKTTKTPIITSRPHPDYPTTVAFPLEDVLNEFENGYFNSTAAYAVAMAIFLGVEKISLFGADFTYPDAHDAEKGRACVEYWLGHASERGIKLAVPKTSTLLDGIYPQRDHFYGYDTVDLRITREGEVIKVDFTERDDIPTADEVEEAYNHDRHPNALMSAVDNKGKPIKQDGTNG